MTKKGEPALELIMAAFLTLMGVVVLITSLQMKNPLRQPLGPGYAPSLLGAAVLILALRQLALASLALRGHILAADRQAVSGGRLRAFASAEWRWMLVAILLLVCLFVWRQFSALAGLMVASLALVVVDGEFKLRTGVPYAIGIALATWLLFTQVLGLGMR